MSRTKLDWFDLQKYSLAEKFTAKDWLCEIYGRVLMDFVFSETHEDLSQGLYEEANLTMNNIKEFGLLSTVKPNKLLIEKQQDFRKLKQYVKNLTTLDAFNLLYYSDKKKSFLLEAQKLDELLKAEFNSVARKGYNDTHSLKYSKAIHLEEIENFDRLEHLDGFQNDLGSRYLEVDINASDEALVGQFRAWLIEERKNYHLEFPKKDISNSLFLDWYKNQVLAYWDIVALSKYEGISLTNDAIGNMLFPNDIEVTISERIRKVVRPKARRVISIEMAEILDSQV